jgi:hypothetical protein
MYEVRSTIYDVGTPHRLPSLEGQGWVCGMYDLRSTMYDVGTPHRLPSSEGQGWVYGMYDSRCTIYDLMYKVRGAKYEVWTSTKNKPLIHPIDSPSASGGDRGGFGECTGHEIRAKKYEFITGNLI